MLGGSSLGASTGWWFGRIPTFEIFAHEPSANVGDILEDVSDRAIECTDPAAVAGYAAYGPSIKAAIAPLIDCFGTALFDDGTHVVSVNSAAPIAIVDDELGNSSDE